MGEGLKRAFAATKKTREKQPTISREDKAMLAIHDHGTREGATAKSVRAALAKCGFTPDEISQAVKQWLGL